MLRNARTKSGLTQAALADAVGLSRQSLNAIEAGRSVPSVAIALKLSRVLEASVEALFAEPASHEVQAELSGEARPGARVVLGWLRERWVAHTRFGQGGSADGFLRASPGALRAKRVLVDLTRSPADVRQTVLLAGCAPGLELLADRLTHAQSGRFRWLMGSNAAALRALSASHVHVAGIHLAMGEASAVEKAAARHLPGGRADIYALASWEAGLVVPRGNPRRILGVAALADPRLRVALREPGSGARQQLDRLLRKHGEDPGALAAHAVPVRSHEEVAYAVALGAADVGFAIRAVALERDLHFIPLVEERFDLIVPEPFAEDERCTRMLDTLTGGALRRELDALGHDASQCGTKVGAIAAT